MPMAWNLREFRSAFGPVIRQEYSMFKTLISTVAGYAAFAALCLFAPLTASAQLTVNDSNCTQGWTLSGAVGNQVLTCNGGAVGGPTGCTIQGPTVSSYGTAVIISAVCSTGSPTSWSWTGGGCGANASYCIASNSGITGLSPWGPSVTYTVTPSNANGAGNQASITINWGGGGGSGVPTGCTLSATAVGATGGTTNLTASCSGGGAPTSYAWTASPTVSGFQVTTSTATNAAAITATTAFTVTPSNASGSGNVATTSVSVNGGGSGTINCATNALPAGGGVTGQTIVRDINWASPQAAVVTGMSVVDAAVIRFTTGPNTSSLLGTMVGVSNNQGDFFAELSPTACDFRQTVANPPPLGFGAIGLGWTPLVYLTVGGSDGSAANLLPNTTYYYNVKVGPNGCNSGNCSATYTLNKPAGM
jgi:hypothetical protein